MRLFSRSQPVWTRGLITWLVYSLSGLTALALAPPHELVSPLYLAAGLGLGAVLGWGRPMALAVGLGGATVVLALQAIHPVMPWSLGVFAQAAVSGVGAGLQTWLASRLVQRGSATPMALDKPVRIGRFLLLAGPVACVVNASMSVGCLVWLGLLPSPAMATTWASWWAGDTLGVLVGTPIMLTLVGSPHALWRSRRLVLGVPLMVTTVLLALAIRQVQQWENERETAVFNQDVSATANAVRLRLNGYLDALEAMHGLYVGSQTVERDEFRLASSHWLHTLGGIRGMGWDERLRLSELPAFEARHRADGMPSYRVFNGRDRRPAAGDELVALSFIEPIKGNEPALGYNVLSVPITRQAYEQARLEGRAISTRAFKLAQERGQQLGVVVYRPVYRGEPTTPAERVKANVGAVFMALSMDDTLRIMLQGSPGYLDACLLDGADPKAPFLSGSAQCRQGMPAMPALGHLRVVPLDFAGTTWQLVVWSQGPVPLAGNGATTWLLAIGGVAFAAALGALLLVMTGHARRIEAAMLEASEQRAAAEAANRAKSEFLSRMSHELRTPLNAVLGFAQVMEIDHLTPLQPTQKQRVQQIQQAGWHLLDMIDDVLDISRIDTGTLRLQSQALPIAEALHAVDTMLADTAARQGVSMSWPSDIPAHWGVMADPTRLRQVLTNLLSNAIKYNQRGGKVTVGVRQLNRPGMGPRMVISVSDTGMGMTPLQLTQLFEPFNRLGRERAIPDGTGIGLVISRHLAVLMGGQLEAESQEGNGSVFTLTLPAADLDEAAPPNAPFPEPSPLPLAPVPARSRHVLYVEDNLINSEVIRAALSERPWVQLSVAPTIEEGLAVLHDRLRGKQPDLILLDVHLPDASGQELLKLIKANPDTAGIPVIMISADATPEQIDLALANGAFCYLTKPVQVAALLRQVDDLLGD